MGTQGLQRHTGSTKWGRVCYWRKSGGTGNARHWTHMTADTDRHGVSVWRLQGQPSGGGESCSRTSAGRAGCVLPAVSQRSPSLLLTRCPCARFKCQLQDTNKLSGKAYTGAATFSFIEAIEKYGVQQVCAAGLEPGSCRAGDWAGWVVEQPYGAKVRFPYLPSGLFSLRASRDTKSPQLSRHCNVADIRRATGAHDADAARHERRHGVQRRHRHSGQPVAGQQHQQRPGAGAQLRQAGRPLCQPP